MEGIRAIAHALCATIIITAILFLMLPGEKFRGILKFSVGLFFLCGILSPFLRSDLSFSFDLTTFSQGTTAERTTAVIFDSLAKLIESNVEQSLYTAAEQQGCKADKIEVTVHIREEGSIYIDQIIAQPTDPQNESALKECIHTHTGVFPNIVLYKGE